MFFKNYDNEYYTKNIPRVNGSITTEYCNQFKEIDFNIYTDLSREN